MFEYLISNVKFSNMERESQKSEIVRLLKSYPVVAILGPRQVGKTTLAREVQKKYKKSHFFDLEDPRSLAILDNPMLALENLQGLVIVDEIQRRPELFPALRVLADRQSPKTKFLILGSASRELIKQSSETLAGRISFFELAPFSICDDTELNRLWLRGGFPRSYLAKSSIVSFKWRQDYVSSFLERDIPLLGFNLPANTLRRFWLMLTHYHGQIFNASEIGSSLGLSSPTMRRYLDILTGTFMVRELKPWIENVDKRQVKSPKIYFRDSGLLLSLMDLRDMKTLSRHPKLGAIWEGFALEQIIQSSGLESEQFFFWSSQSESELDLLLFKNGKRFGFEVKYTDQPKITKSMRVCIETLKLDKLTLVIPGSSKAQLDSKIFVNGLDIIA